MEAFLLKELCLKPDKPTKAAPTKNAILYAHQTDGAVQIAVQNTEQDTVEDMFDTSFKPQFAILKLN